MSEGKAPERLSFALLKLGGKHRPIFRPVLTTISMERATDTPIIADSSGLVSLATITDQNHTPALNAAARLRKASRPIILPADILVETVNVLGKKSGHETALKAAGELLRLGSQFILIETRPYLLSALNKALQPQLEENLR